MPAHGADDAPAPITGSTTVVELLQRFPGGEAAALMARLAWPCAHCSGALHEPVSLAAKRHANRAGPVVRAFQALASTAGRARRRSPRPPANTRSAPTRRLSGRATGGSSGPPCGAACFLSLRRRALVYFISLRRRALAPLAWLTRRRGRAGAGRCAARSRMSPASCGCRALMLRATLRHDAYASLTTSPVAAARSAASVVLTASIDSSGVMMLGGVFSRMQRAK